MSINRVTLLGYVGSDPVYYKKEGIGEIARFPLCTSRRGYRRDDGAYIEPEEEWHMIVCFKQWYDVVRSHVRKGDKLFIEGSLHNERYVGKGGEERYSAEIRARMIELVSSASYMAGLRRSGDIEPVVVEKCRRGELSADDIPF